MILIKWDKKQCGVYCLRHKDSGKVYIGSSVNCYHRIKSQHLAKLRKRIHTNPHLQAAFCKYGEKAFEYFIIEECKARDMLRIEQKYFGITRCLDSQFGYNINPNAEKTELTKEQCEKIRIAKLGKRRTNKRQVGVFRTSSRWVARIGFYGEDIYLGSFLSQRKAKRVYEAAFEMAKVGKKPIISEERILKDKLIVQRTLEGKFVKRFSSLKAVEADGHCGTTVWRYCVGKIKKPRKYIWEYE